MKGSKNRECIEVTIGVRVGSTLHCGIGNVGSNIASRGLDDGLDVAATDSTLRRVCAVHARLTFRESVDPDDERLRTH